MRKFLLLVVLLSLLVACGGDGGAPPTSALPAEGTSTAPSSSAEPLNIRVGLQAPFSGPSAFFGERLQGGALFALEKAGSVMVGDRELQIELRFADDEGLAEKGPIAAQQLIDDGVAVVLGPGFSGPAGAAIPLFAQHGIPMLSPWGAADNLTELSDWFFRVFPPNRCQAEVLVELALGAGAKTVATVDDNQAYGSDISAGVKQRAVEAGLEISGEYHGSAGLLDWSPIVQRLLQDSPDLVIYNGYPDEAGRFVAQARDRGFDSWIIGSDGIGTPTIFDVADPDKLTSKFGALALIPAELMSGPTESAEWKTFKSEYPAFAESQKFSDSAREAELYVALAYDAMNLLLDSLQQAGSADGEDLRAALLSTDFNGLSGPFSYDQRGERDLCFSTFLEVDPATQTWRPSTQPSDL